MNTRERGKRGERGERRERSSSCWFFWRGRLFCSTSDGIPFEIKTLYLESIKPHISTSYSFFPSVFPSTVAKKLQDIPKVG